MSLKSIIADLNKGDKLNGENYDIWSRKMWYVLEEQYAIEGINHVMSHPEEGNTAQHRRDLETYNILKKKNSTICGIIVSSVVDDLIHECEQYPTTQAIWAHFREAYGSTTVTRLRQLTIKFDTYKKRHDHNVKQHLRVMPNMIAQHKSVGHVLSNEQQVQAVIRIKTFADVTRHVELEDEWFGTAKVVPNAFVAESSGTKRSSFKRKRN
uniref:Uncharacterized protein LOC104239064 n=1 Tax=Nicotiana sylvestris TaxID=4096 RepID=A0A1U7XY64_NICSY|nr:PREDICTED: uncharacterized protein LOC104239064 [Nicotiana sylvestris]